MNATFVQRKVAYTIVINNHADGNYRRLFPISKTTDNL
jgi:hypothetical protein